MADGIMQSLKIVLPQKVKDGLRTKVIGRTIHSFRELQSTNDMSRRLAMRNAKEGTVIVAETQTCGRGRFNRKWASPEGGLWFSIILRPRCKPKDAVKLTLATSVAVARTISKLFGLETQIKWPNDVLIDGKKVCGILTEASTKGDILNFVAIGVGINTNFTINSLPSNLRYVSTSLREELGREIERETFLRETLEAIEKYYDLFLQRRFGQVLDEWKTLASFLGSFVKVTGFGEEIEGWATNIDDDGRLILKLKDQTTRKIVSGDVTLHA